MASEVFEAIQKKHTKIVDKHPFTFTYVLIGKTIIEFSIIRYVYFTDRVRESSQSDTTNVYEN